MKTIRRKYQVSEAHSGTNEKEIEKAKRRYRQGVIKGEYPNSQSIILTFDDRNGHVFVKYTDIDDYTILGHAVIY